MLQIAKWLGAPVVLVVDCWAMARSAAALVKGYSEFDPGAPCTADVDWFIAAPRNQNCPPVVDSLYCC
jgi:cobyrinic acid a,c-diamide synthase